MSDPIEAAYRAVAKELEPWIIVDDLGVAGDAAVACVDVVLAALSADGPVVLYDGEVLEHSVAKPREQVWGYAFSVNAPGEYVVARLPEGGDDEPAE